MPIPYGRPDNVLNAIRAAFENRSVWPEATANPENYHQIMGLGFKYIALTPEGYVLTDLGRREI